MKHYKDLQNNLFGFEDNDTVPEGLVEITMDEVHAINATKQQALFNQMPYTEKRASDYPSIQEQLDMQYWDAINGTTTWQDAINAVKTAHPKGQ